MESNTANPLGKRRTTAEIKQLLLEQEESNGTVKEFCAIRGIPEGTFYNWRKKYNAGQQATGDFISLQVSRPDVTASLFAEIEYPGKAMVRLFRPVDSSYLKSLL